MAINVEVLKTRALTAVVFVAVMLTGLLWNQWSFIALFTIIHFGCWYEFVKLMKKIYGEQYLKYCLLGLIYITLPILMLMDLMNIWNDVEGFKGNADFGNIIPIAIIFSIWINDTMAYLVGSLIGKTPFSKISPKKTWEGTGGGAILCVLVIGFLFPLVADKYFYPSVPKQTWFIIAGICAVFGTMGDLLESKIKRMADVKDSGSIMPGHGGFLDRFDSLLIAVPFVWVYVKLFV
ncbi:MAG: phosphatidate cytidylyltransferase [Ferruginibacter sp.]|uniref:phosphatidate cytidylyltransferase n=1 Tax=Ferruginibacter sp. TaxID=1940288 RepID=UPI00265A2452|nr:phosphatidate cytidylyltransferase [Ferruginibacter sp.]MDB5280429.1 phosphatidate cytidylyltransferase [Ferruginibacter sp.]